MSFTPAKTDHSPEHDVTLGDEEAFSYSPNDDDDASGFTAEYEGRQGAEKTACERCRRRKIKCDRVNPCTSCTRAQAQCQFLERRKPVTKRQRVLISSIYESRMEHITRKIDGLAEMMERLDQPRPSSDAKYNAEPAPKPQRKNEHVAKKTGSTSKNARNTSSFAENDAIDASLFVHAIKATKLLEEAVSRNHDSHSQNIAQEMRTSIETLQAVVDSQKRRPDAQDNGPPFSKSLPPGTTTTRDLPLPPITDVMACLRMAQEHPRVQIFWTREFRSLADFTAYVIKVCSPGPADATDAELIIVHTGLYWLFSECALVVSSEEVQQEFTKQSLLCRDNLEIVLSHLSFYMPATGDWVYALYLATLYCYQRGKISTAWSFISRASLLAHTAGFHSNSAMANELPDERSKKSYVFWIVYCLERSLSLRLGRSSSMRDIEITVPKPEPIVTTTNFGAHSDLAGLVEASRVFGSLFEQLFCPSSFSLSADVRAARAQSLVADWERIMAHRANNQKRQQQTPEYLENSTLIDFIAHASNVGDYAALTAIHRVAHGRSLTSGVSISSKCTASARAALKEHIECITLLRNEELRSAHLDLWVNGAMILSPFIPFNIVFCNVIETADATDLGYLKTLVDALEALSRIPRFASCAKQLRIFKTLHNVAAKYVEIRPKQLVGHMPNSLGDSRAYSGNVAQDANMQTDSGAAIDTLDLPPVPAVLESQSWADFSGMEIDPLGMQLGNWFQDGNDMMNFVEES